MITHFSPVGRAIAGTLTASVLLAGALLAAGPASAVGVANPVCPQGRANVGIPIVTANALDPNDHAVTVSLASGSLPAGVTLSGLTRVVPFTFSGTPTVAGTSNFTVKAQFEDAPAVTISCTMTVGTLPTPSRIGGVDRYEQAVLVSDEFATADTVYLASGEKFSDALSAGAVAGIHGAPLLLTQSGVLPTVTAQRIAQLAPDDVVVVGGPATISDAVMNAVDGVLPAASAVTRIGGVDRYDVSRHLVADPEFGVPSTTWSYLADGRNFPDALAATPPATVLGGPVLLVDGGAAAASTETRATLQGLGVTDVRIAGGPASVGEGIVTSLNGFAVTRVSGATRYDGAVAINQTFTAVDRVYLASGEVYPDALSAGPLAGETESPLYLVHRDCVPAAVLDDIERVGASEIVVLGGINTLTTAVQALKPC